MAQIGEEELTDAGLAVRNAIARVVGDGSVVRLL